MSYGDDSLSKAITDKIAAETAKTLIESLTHDEQIALVKPGILKLIRDHRVDYKVQEKITEMISEMVIKELMTDDFQRAMKEKAITLADMWLAVCFKESAWALIRNISNKDLHSSLHKLIKNTKFLGTE